MIVDVAKHRIDVLHLVIEKLSANDDLIPAICSASLSLWKNDNLLDEVHADFISTLYTSYAPEVKILNELRIALGTRFLGSWKENSGWCSTNDRTTAIENIKKLISKEI